MIGRRPEPVPGEVPGRWRVVRARGLGEHWPTCLQGWYVERDGCHGSMWFPTWREAQDYADRMARTREVVLPRLGDSGDPVPGAPNLTLGWEYPNWADKPVIWIGQNRSYLIYIAPEELRPLGEAVLALAEQEGHA